MKWFRDSPIGRKLMLVMMLTSSVAVLLVVVTKVFYEVVVFRQAIVQDLSVQAAIIGENCAAALEFDNARTAQETLASLKARPDIVAACVYRNDGSVFAGYVASGRPPAPFPSREADNYRTERGDLVLFHRIIRKSELLGTVYLQSNLQPHYRRLIAGIAIAVGAMLASWVLAWVLAARLQRVISDPILDLADVAAQVKEQPNYALRVRRHGNDEIGTLTDGFNRMLENIQQRDVELRTTEKEVLEISDREQGRIGMDLHDGLAQDLVVTVFDIRKLEAKLRDGGQPQLAAEAHAIGELLQQAITQIRDIAQGLHPVKLEVDGLRGALDELCRTLSKRSGVDCRLDWTATVAVKDNAVATHLYRIAQEAANNSIKHSHATMLTLGLQGTNGELTLRVSDNGRGFATPSRASTGMGLHIMRYRARLINATLRLEPRAEGGTVVEVTVPVTPAPQ